MICDIKNIDKSQINHKVTVAGWIKSHRDSGGIGFINLNDGTFLKGIQIVYKEKPEFINLKTGDAIIVVGKLVQGKGAQGWEILAQNFILVNQCSTSYPLQKKKHSLEFLRSIAHLRPKANSINAVMKVRSELSFAIHQFYHNEGFIYVHTPIITGNDAEGAGESFLVTTKKGDKESIDNFFGQKALLTVSGQLHAEAYAQAFKKVYTFGPTFRSENSNTSRHAAEFWMVEPEIAFTKIDDIMHHGEKLIKFVLQYLFTNCYEELIFFNNVYDKNLIAKLQNVINSPFVKMSYLDIIKILEKAVAKGHKFVDNNIFKGMDFGSEHERYIAENIVKGPVFATYYPKEIKAFYMKINQKDNTLVDSFDLLVPGIGELIGGSARENDYEILLSKMKAENIDYEILKWYLELRKFGSAPSGGFGLGLERLIMYVTGIENIRDVIPFPRTPKNLKF